MCLHLILSRFEMLMQKKKNLIPITVLVIGSFLMITWIQSKMYFLKHYGTRTNGIVQAVYKVGSKGQSNCEYTFYIKGEPPKRGSVLFDLLEVGDSIIVLYSPSYPSINVPEKVIEENY